ncbi:MAG: GGDEF domain-containing protein [Proteobacteria bacterium]|nr:GGDEF domain-containing protein [Pseudomonadota bacterium]MCP4917035.1 GGDEF domain-containing protein [Pseudomonadota bacterium]
MKSPRLLRSEPATRLLEHHQRHYGLASVVDTRQTGVPIRVGARIVARLQATGPDEAVRGLALALGSLLDALADERERQRRVTDRLILLTRRLRRAEGRLIGAIEERKVDLLRQQRRLADVAQTDALTGCLNRRALDVRLVEIGEACAQVGAPVAVLFCDIDHFKRVNDTHGHSVGDQVLERTGRLLMDGRRRGDLVGRWGGEEFVVVLPDCPEVAACRIAEEIRGTVSAQLFDGSDGAFRVTTSVGVTVGCLDADDVRAGLAGLIDAADQRLYEAKESGRNRVVSGSISPLREAG